MITIKQEVFDFLLGLKQNNNRDWFDDNRTLYEKAKANIEEFAAFLISEISKFDNVIPVNLNVKKCVLRIYRDVRFSINKAPYKNNFAIIISPDRMKEGPCYFIHIEPGNNFIGGGYWRPSANPLKALRQEIDYNTDEFLSIINEMEFKSYFGELEREDVLRLRPKGYPADHPYMELLKLKSFVCSKSFSDEEMMSEIGIKEMLRGLELVTPFNYFLAKAIE